MVTRTVGYKYSLTITDIDESKNIDKDVLVEGIFKEEYIPSVNSMYILDGGRKILDPVLRVQRRKIWQQLEIMGYKKDTIPQDCKLTIEVGFYLKSSINKRDLDNMLKYTIDSIAEYFNFNDNRIYKLACYKRLVLDANEEITHFRIRRLEENKNNYTDNL